MKKMPKMPKIKEVGYPIEKTPVVEYEYGDAFTNLKKEFEKIRDELERIA